MKRIVDTIANDRGSALVVALLVLVLLTLMGISATTTSTIELAGTGRRRTS
jgi:Tfp pilus assembly protein PilX